MGRERAARAPRRQMRLATPGAALAVGVLILVMLVSAGVLSQKVHDFRLSGLGQGALFLSFAVVGVIVAWHQPRNPMGWAAPSPFRSAPSPAIASASTPAEASPFAARLQDAVDLGTVRSELLSTVDQALEPAHVTVWTGPAD